MAGAGAFEVAVADALVKHKSSVKGRAQLGVQAFADALLIIPKVPVSLLPLLSFYERAESIASVSNVCYVQCFYCILLKYL